jgi:cell division protein FtsW
LQISEVAKLITLMYLAGYMVRHGKELSTSPSYKPLLIPLGAMGFIGALLLLEPDFGTMLVIMASSIALLFLGGVRIQRLLLVILGAITIMIPFLLMGGYRTDRITAFFDPWSYATSTSYQTVHALMAVGNGGWFGTGLGGGVIKLYTPESHNDYIFSVLAEEFGFIGIVVVLFLFAWLVKRAFVIGFNADKVKQHYSAYLAYGIGFWIGFQVLFHAGVNMDLLPPKGLTLPFISYGGSSLLITCIAMAFLMRIHRETQFALYGANIHNKKQPLKKTIIKTNTSKATAVNRRRKKNV